MSISECNLAQLGVMVKGETGRDLTDYIGYGNWCGFGGEGDAMDEIDQYVLIYISVDLG